MTKLRHIDHDGRVRFITFSCHRRLPILTNTLFRGVVTAAIDDGRARYGFRLLGYVIMPEHVHLILWPTEKSRVGVVVGWIKQEAAKRIIAVLKTKRSLLLAKLRVQRNRIERRAVWQRRCYDHNCRGADAVLEKITYCHNNPVKRGLVRNPSLWTFSSFNWYQGAREVPLQLDTVQAIRVNPPFGWGTKRFPLDRTLHRRSASVPHPKGGRFSEGL